MGRNVAIIVGIMLALLTAPLSKAVTVEVASCVEFTVCWTGPGPTPWSDTLTLADLTGLGLGSTVPLVAAQTSEFVIRLGATTMTFSTTTGPVTESLAEFSGSFHTDPCDFCEIDTVGTFFIPTNATGATISGTFGNSLSPTSAGLNVCLNDGPPCASSSVPEPRMMGFLITALLGIVFASARRAKLGNRIAS